MRQVKLSSLDLNLLVALDVLLESGSVSEAARRLHRSQPAMSRILARLRDTFDDPLLVPHGRGLVPTPRASALRGALKVLLSEARRLVSPLAPFEPATTAARFRLLSSDYAQVVLMGSVMTWLGRAAPRVSLEVQPITREALNALASGAAELLLGPEELVAPWCQMERLLDDPWVAVRRRGETIPSTLSAYLGLDHVAVSSELGLGNPVEAALELKTDRARAVKLRVPDFAGALFVVASSPLIATVPRPVGVAGAALLPIDVGRLPFKPVGPPIAMIWPRWLDREPAHVWLRQVVRERLSGAGLG